MRFFSTLLASFLGTLIGLGLLVFFGLIFVFALASSAEQAPSVRPGTVVVAELSGLVPERVSGDPVAQAFGGEPALGLHDLTRALRMAAADDRVDGLWLQFGDVQASWADLQTLRREIQAVRSAGKRVIASSDLYYMSEDELFLASAADSVLLDPESMFEFNGFALQVAFFADLFDDLGINPQTVQAGRFKSANEPFTRRDLSEENREQLAAMAQDIHATFVSAIAEGRGLSEADVDGLLQEGTIMTARQALDAGLIDGLAFPPQMAEAFGEDPRRISMKRYARSSATAAGIPAGRDGVVAVVHAQGTIMPGGDGGLAGGGAAMIGSETFAAAMTQAREDDDVDAVVVRINSPGGFAPAADAMRHAIERTLEEKPVVVSMGSLAASGGYWMAAPADTIVAEPLTITGSIGVFSLFLDVSGLLEDRLGITIDEVKTAPGADMMSGVRPLRPAEREALQASTDQTYQRFLEVVSEGRGMTTAEVDAVGQGRVWTGMDAQELGLVDVLGGLETALDLAAERASLGAGTYRVMELPRQKTFVERLSASMEARIQGPNVTSVLPQPLRSVVEALQAVASTPSRGVQARLPFELLLR
ncbi:MAG: signal peptide peptidase SppA [Rhodothermales bacterium]|nr:signal peptide peptidase SppA [Rhodothermales bacterium]MBO6780741.1 signal peptide peptidase SppA [Rhodothermales bacterium]